MENPLLGRWDDSVIPWKSFTSRCSDGYDKQLLLVNIQDIEKIKLSSVVCCLSSVVCRLCVRNSYLIKSTTYKNLGLYSKQQCIVNTILYAIWYDMLNIANIMKAAAAQR